jgi:hypothetical protein
VSADGGFSLETSPEVAAGAMAPALRIDTLVFGPVSAAQVRHLVQERRRTAAASGGTASGGTAAAGTGSGRAS